VTGLDLIESALRRIGVLASGESLGATESSDALVSLNDLIDSWSTESLLIPNKIREVFPLVVGQGTYQMGSGAPDFNSSRPQKIENALLQFPDATNVLELPIQIVNQDEYAAILIKQLQSTIPLYLYSDGAFPNTNLNVWPVPSTSYNLVLYSWKPLAEVATLTTEISLPPGYSRALKYNLAIDLAPEYGKSVSPEVAAIATSSLATIKRMNTKPLYLKCDAGTLGKPGVWDYRIGDYR
jgi:hypothetical protein